MLKTISIGKQKKEIKRFSRFLVVGLSGTLIDFGILTGLKMLLNMPTLPANIISYSAGVINNFTLNRLWTFSEARDNQWFVQFGKFVLINVGAVALNSLIVLGLEQPLGTLLHNPEQGYLPAKVVATGIVFVYNFLANRLWTFREVGRSG